MVVSSYREFSDLSGFVDDMSRATGVERALAHPQANLPLYKSARRIVDELADKRVLVKEQRAKIKMLRYWRSYLLLVVMPTTFWLGIGFGRFVLA